MGYASFRDKLRYRSDRFFQSGFTLQLFISALIVLAVITGFYIVAELSGIHPGPDFGVQNADDTGPYWPSVRLWWVIMHVMESYWLETSTWSQILSIALTLFNFLVFAAIVGLVGSRIQQRLEQVRRGTSRVVEEGHIVILGWSGKVLPIIRELHAGLEGKQAVVVIMSERPIDEVDNRIRKLLRHLKGKGKRAAKHSGPGVPMRVPRRKRLRLRWVIRQGSLTDLKDLELLAIEHASEVIVLQPDGLDGRGDVQVIKTIMGVSHLIGGHNTGDDRASRSTPDIIAEIERPTFVELARAAARGSELSIIQPTDHLSKIILQTARQPGLVDVYNEILSHEKNEVHFTPAGPLAGRTWEEAVFSFRRAMPIGVFRDGKPLLAPAATGDGFRIESGDDIIAIARDQAAMRVEAPVLPPRHVAPQSVTVRDTQETPVRNVLVLGWSEMVMPMLREYAGYARSMRLRFAVTIASPTLPAGLSPAEVADIIGAEDELDITLLNIDYLATSELERLQPGGFEAIIVLDESEADTRYGDPDTRVIMTLLLLRSLRDDAERHGVPYPQRQQIVGEILDVNNKELVEATGTVRDVIISNDLVSKMIAQVCRERRTEMVMQEFFDEDGTEIYLKPASWYAPIGSTATFDVLVAAALARGEAAFGYAIMEDVSAAAGLQGPVADSSSRVEINPLRDTVLRIDAQLRMVVIAEGEDGRAQG